jgi:glycosyltransferase involved in cell wall biosynthesis
LPCGEWARRAAKKCGIDYSVWLLGSDVWSLGRVPVLRGMLARVIRQARNAYADGYMLADDARQIGSRPVEFLPSTRRIDVTAPMLPHARPPYRLLVLGRWHPNKGVDLLLDALESLSDADWRNVESFEIQGGGPLESMVHERVAVLRGANRPVMAGGFLAKPDAEAAIERCDWLVIPSRIESIPVVFSDAMKLRRPVIATPVGDLGRLLSESKAGLVAQGATARDLTVTLRLALASNASEFAVQTEKLAAEFDLARIAERLMMGFAGVAGDAT